MKKLIFLSLLTISIIAKSQNTQFRGPERNGIYKDVNLLQEWPAGGPQMILSFDGIGLGWSQPILSKGIIYVTGMLDTTDYLSAVDMSGKLLWRKPYGRSWTKSNPDTRCTPTIDDDRIYVMSGTGNLQCFNAKNGSVIWSFEVDTTYKSKWHRWGVAESPLIVDDKVIVTPGGDIATAVAFNKMTGKLVWQSPPLGDVRSYISATIYKYKQFRYILASTYDNIVAIDPATGTMIWKYGFNLQKQGSKAIAINSPIYKNDEIYISNGYDYPSMMLKIAADGKSVSQKWMDNTLDNHHHGLINVGNYIFGSNWISNTEGKWVCLKWDTGEVQYEKDWFSKGPMVYADKMLYVIDEKFGNVGLVKPTPEGFNVISTFTLKKGKGEFWAHPSIYDGKLFLRYNGSVMVYNIKK
jgi:outer membrane protein assembly factor BamB